MFHPVRANGIYIHYGRAWRMDSGIVHLCAGVNYSGHVVCSYPKVIKFVEVSALFYIRKCCDIDLETTKKQMTMK